MAKRILEAAALHAAQKTVETVIEQAKSKVAEHKSLNSRVTALEADIAALKTTSPPAPKA